MDNELEQPLRADVRHGTIPRMALDAARRWPDDAAVVDGELRLTFGDVGAGMRDVAAGLVARGVEPGDRVALWAPNSASWIVAALGVQATGAWLVPLNTRFKGDEAAFVLRHSDARVLLVVDRFLGTDHLAEVQAADPHLRCLDDAVRMPGPAQRTTADWDDLLRGGSTAADEVEHRLVTTSADDISDVIFTSGTTGKPKGVLLRHGTSLRCYQSYNTAYRLGAGDRHLITTPFFHCFGYKAGWMLSLMVGATTHPMAQFDAGEVLRIIERERITHMPGAPTVFTSLLVHPDRARHDLSSLRVAMVAAATIPEQLVRDMAGVLGFDAVMSGYGLTENHALGSFSRPDDPLEVVATTVGALAPDLVARIVDDAGADVERGTPGELLLGGYAHMSGYYLDDEATRAVLRDGWLHTGDVAVLGEDDRLRITGRKKDMLVVGGFNVAPAEVEDALLRLGTLAQAAVIGIPDERFGEVAMAYVVPLPGARVTAADVIDHARATIANYKVPRRVEVVDELPTNASGKVLKHVLREQAARSR